MKGTVHYTEDMGWVVRYIEMREFHQEDQLHPDDFENITEGVEIDFEIVEHQKLTGFTTYAKIKNSKQK